MERFVFSFQTPIQQSTALKNRPIIYYRCFSANLRFDRGAINDYLRSRLAE